DNGTQSNRPPRAVRYSIDTTARTATLVENVTDPAVTNSTCCGSARKLAGGNWVIAWGCDPQVEELTPSGTVVFSLTLGGSTKFSSYRAYPVTSASWGGALDTGMSTRYPRAPGGT